MLREALEIRRRLYPDGHPDLAYSLSNLATLLNTIPPYWAAGLNQMICSMANELAAHSIRANVVEPGWIETPGELRFATREQMEEAGKRLPLGRIGTIEDIGAAVAYLTGPGASYVTGAVLRVDGGFVLPRPAL